MKRIVILFFAIVMLLSACASPVQPTTIPTEQIQSIPTSTPQPMESTATATLIPEPTMTPTPVPPPPHWYWGVDADTENVIAVNQFGEQHKLGSLDQMDPSHTISKTIDNERALLFLDNDNTLRMYLLTPNEMQKITLPPELLHFNTELSQAGRGIVAVHEDVVVFSYVTESSTFTMPDTGLILLLDLKSLTVKLIDKTVSRDKFSDNRRWLHTSQDGRYLSYLNGNEDNMDIRELDMVTGETRTIYTTSGSSYNIRASPYGDLWYLRTEKIILDLNGNKTTITDDTLTVRPIKDGKIITFPRNCLNDCEIKVTSPFGNEAELTYNFPWGISEGLFYANVSQLLPDQSLLFAGSPALFFSDTPAIMATYPKLTEKDLPLFRLTPDGQAQLVGIYIEEDYTKSVSDDGQYILLKSPDQTSFFIYDVVVDRSFFDLSPASDLEKFFTSVNFFEDGILVYLSASVVGKENDYRFLYYGYPYQTSMSLAWEDVNEEITSCPDLLEDGSVICWFFQTDSTNFDLIRLDPATGEKIPLLENVWLIEYIQ